MAYKKITIHQSSNNLDELIIHLLDHHSRYIKSQDGILKLKYTRNGERLDENTIKVIVHGSELAYIHYSKTMKRTKKGCEFSQFRMWLVCNKNPLVLEDVKIQIKMKNKNDIIYQLFKMFQGNRQYEYDKMYLYSGVTIKQRLQFKTKLIGVFNKLNKKKGGRNV